MLVNPFKTKTRRQSRICFFDGFAGPVFVIAIEIAISTSPIQVMTEKLSSKKISPNIYGRIMPPVIRKSV